MTTRPPGRLRDARAVVVYSLARVGLFAVCYALGWLAGLTGLLLVVVALLVSGVLSWFLLQRWRLAMGAAVADSVERTRLRFDTAAAAEDAYVDAMQAPAGVNSPRDLAPPDRAQSGGGSRAATDDPTA